MQPTSAESFQNSSKINFFSKSFNIVTYVSGVSLSQLSRKIFYLHLSISSLLFPVLYEYIFFVSLQAGMTIR